MKRNLNELRCIFCEGGNTLMYITGIHPQEFTTEQLDNLEKNVYCLVCGKFMRKEQLESMIQRGMV